MSGRSEDSRWRELCEAILNEPDQGRLHELISMLNDELEARENRFRDKMDRRGEPNKSNSQPEV